MNGSNVSHYDEDYTADSFTIIFIKELAYAIVTVVALVGNSLAIASVFQTPRMRTITNYLIVNMAIVDIIFTIIAIPQTFLVVANYNIVSESAVFEVFGCKATNFFHYALQGVSVLTLAAIATDRYFAIMIPFKKFLTKRVFYVVLVIIWLVGIAVASPVPYAYRVLEVEGYLYCGEEWEPLLDSTEASKVYTVVLFIVIYCIPFLAMTVIYSIICNKLWTRKPIGELNQSGKKILESRKKVVKMLVTVVVGFVICWLPAQIVSLWGYFKEVNIIPEWLMFLCFFVMHAHPALNPCIYVIFSQNFRDGFKMAVKCYCCMSSAGKSSLVSNPTKIDRCLLKNEENEKGEDFNREVTTARETVC